MDKSEEIKRDRSASCDNNRQSITFSTSKTQKHIKVDATAPCQRFLLPPPNQPRFKESM